MTAKRSVFALLQDASLLFFRLVLAYGFFEPFLVKVIRFDGFVRWLERLHFSFPVFNGYLVVAMQGLAVVLLTLGLATRIISIGLLYQLAIGLLAVHWENGFAARNNGFEIPLYYILMLFALFIQGPGRCSLDGLLVRKYRPRFST